jgi:hypothetical protein
VSVDWCLIVATIANSVAILYLAHALKVLGGGRRKDREER